MLSGAITGTAIDVSTLRKIIIVANLTQDGQVIRGFVFIIITVGITITIISVSKTFRVESKDVIYLS